VLLLAAAIAVAICQQTGEVDTLAGSGTETTADGLGTAASFNTPTGIALSADGADLYVCGKDHTIRVVSRSTAAVTTLAGFGTASTMDDTGTAAGFNHPAAIAVTQDGLYLYVSDYGGNVIRLITLSTAQVTTIAGSGTASTNDGIGTAAAFNSPIGLVLSLDEQYLYISEYEGHVIRMLTLSTAQVTTIAGNSAIAGNSNGIATVATFNYPGCITMSLDGSLLYVAGNLDHSIREITLSTAEVRTLAGSGTDASIDGIGTAASFSRPRGLALSGDGAYMFVSTFTGHKIRMIKMDTLEVTTLAGNGIGISYDGIGTHASLNQPGAVTLSLNASQLYVAELNGNRVRVVSTGYTNQPITTSTTTTTIHSDSEAWFQFHGRNAAMNIAASQSQTRVQCLQSSPKVCFPSNLPSPSYFATELQDSVGSTYVETSSGSYAVPV